MANGSRTRSTSNHRTRRNVPASPKARTAKKAPKGAATAGRARVTLPRVAEPMWALVYDVEKDKWDKTRGFRKTQVAKPTIDPKNRRDANSVIVRRRAAAGAITVITFSGERGCDTTGSSPPCWRRFWRRLRAPLTPSTRSTR